MKNLNISCVFKIENECFANIQNICQNCFSGLFYVLNEENELLSVDVDNKVAKKLNFTWKSDDRKKLNTVAMHYLMDEMGVCIAFANGDIVVFDCENELTSCVASVAAGISTVSISPDQEIVVIVTKENKFILMDKMFDPICEKSIDVSEFGCGEAVNVGWGSKQTQFHGSEGKEAAKQKSEPLSLGKVSHRIENDVKVNGSIIDMRLLMPPTSATPALPTDDKKIRVDWKSDGNYFSITSVDLTKLCRKIRIWSRDGELHYTSEDVDGLEHLLAWKPSANLFACSQQSRNKHQIVFFEKNGLRHGEFVLPYKPGSLRIENILWSPDSDVLSIIATEMKNGCENQIMMIWTSSNYHWYQKQTYHFGNNKITIAQWDNLSRLKLIFVTNDGSFFGYQWNWEINSCDDSVAVIDGEKVLITSFEKNVIPPPMFGWSVSFDEPIHKVMLNSSCIVACLSDGRIVSFTPETNKEKLRNGFTFTINSKQKQSDGDGNCNFVVIEKLENYLIRRCFLISDGSLLLIASSDTVSNEIIRVKGTEDISLLLKLPTDVLTACYDDEDSALVIQTLKGSVVKYCLKENSLKNWKDQEKCDVKFPERCPNMQLAVLNNRKRVFGLSTRFTLFCDNTTLVTSGCTSFSIHNNQFLLFTTTDHFLRCWSLDSEINVRSKSDFENEERRKIERGSKIVVCVSKDAKVVLQAPRGNLETVFPRVIILRRIVDSLNELNYKEAFSVMRKHRINLNLLIDHNVQSFVDNIEAVISQIGSEDVMNLCLLLSELVEENVCMSMYSYAYKDLPKSVNGKSKLDLVCDVLQERLRLIDSKKYLIPILVTHVKKSNAQFGEALLEIKNLKDHRDREASLKYLLYLVDINRLYDEALGTYDFDVVVMVAQQSSKDPKEYLSFVNSLQQIEPPEYRNYKIDVHLKRFEKALYNLSFCKGEEYFNECIEFIDKHRLYKSALKLFKGLEAEQIWKKYADYLLVKKYFEEAAVAYKLSGDFNNALKAYQLSGNWNAAVDICKSINKSSCLPLLKSLAESLKSNSKFQEAAFIYETFIRDDNEAASIYIKAHLWDHASRIVNQLNDELLRKAFSDEILDQKENMITFISQNEEQLLKYVSRFNVVRKARLETNQFHEEFDDTCDSVSDVSSQSDGRSVRSTSGSLSTRKSAKSKKKHERKQYSLKEGSRNEFEGLLMVIKEIIEKTDRVQEEIALLIKTLYCHHFENDASMCQNRFLKYLSLIQSTIPQVWQSEETIGAELSVNQRMKLNLTGSQPFCADQRLLIPPQIRTVNWKFALLTSD